MSLKTITTHGVRTCAECGKSIPAGVEAKADFQTNPYTFLHAECALPPKEAQEDVSEMMFAMLADIVKDTLEIRNTVKRIEDKLVSLGYKELTVADAMGGKK